MLKDAENVDNMYNNKGGLGKNGKLFECELLKDAENVDDMGEGKHGFFENGE